MKYKIKKEVYEKKVEEKEVNLPEKTLYFWHNGIRRAYMVSPEWTTWNKQFHNKGEEIYKLNILCIDPEHKYIKDQSVEISFLKDIVDYEKHPLHRLINNLLFYPDENTRTKKQFMQDYKNILSSFNELANAPSKKRKK